MTCSHVFRARELHGCRWVARCGRLIENGTQSANPAEATCVPCVYSALQTALYRAAVSSNEALDANANYERLRRRRSRR